MKKFLLIFLSLLLLKTNHVLADVFSIAALVNEQIISVLDLQSRMKLVFGTSNVPYNEETVKHFEPQILHQMIDDVLKIEEAKKLGIEISKEEIDDAIATVEKNNRMQKGDLEKMVASFGIGRETLEMQMKSEISWLRIAGKQMMSGINITDEEVNEIIARKKENVGKPEMLVYEIFLPIDETSKDEEVFENAKKLIGYVASGGDFSSLATQFSQKPTAAKGGELGWIHEGQLEKELDDVIIKMTPPSISSPIKTRYGYYILFLKDKRLADVPDETKAVYDLSQIFIPSKTPETEKSELLSKIKTITSCSDFNSLAKELGTPNSGSLGEIPIKTMPAAILNHVKDLEIAKPSSLMPITEGFLVFMVCNKNIPGGLPSAEAVKHQLKLEKLDKIARRKLRELRRSSIIEIRK